MRLAFTVAGQSGCSLPFHDRMAVRGWLHAFRSPHPQISFRSPQALSFCHTVSTIDDFFAKLG